MRRSLWVLGFSIVCALSAAGAAQAAAPDTHGEDAGHGDHGGEHVPSFDEINWFYGMVGEKEGVEPNILFRPPGMPAPFGALLVNTAILYFILYRIFRKPISEGLRNRKANIMRGMEEAARMRREAEEQLAFYEAKLAGIDEEVQRIKREMREAGEAERARILAEARERRERMERDAHVLIEQELKGVREQLLHETLTSAIRSAEQLIAQRLGPSEQQAFAERHLADIRSAASSLRGRV